MQGNSMIYIHNQHPPHFGTPQNHIPDEDLSLDPLGRKRLLQNNNMIQSLEVHY